MTTRTLARRQSLGGRQSLASRQSLQEAIRFWSDFIARCISKRLDTETFREFVRLVHEKHPLPAVIVADLFLRPQPSNNISLDPRMPPWVQALMALGFVDAPSVLRALYKHSALRGQLQQQQGEDETTGTEGQDGTTGTENNDGADGGQKDNVKCWKCSAWVEEIMFFHVIKTLVEGSAFRNDMGALELVDIICRWMHLFVTASNAFAATIAVNAAESQARDEMELARAAFVPLLVRLVDNVHLLKALAQPAAKNIRKQLADSLVTFAQVPQPVPQFAEKLELFRTETLAAMDPVDKTTRAAAEAMNEMLDANVGAESMAIPEMVLSPTRTGLFVYLSSLLVGRPILDDSVLFAYLNNRYQGNAQDSAIDLILASFDALAAAAWKKPNSRDGNLLRSYLVNKLPLLLCQLVPPEFSTTTSEFCITQALNQLDTNVFPTASLMFGSMQESNQHMDSVREEFCSACALHGLIQREHVDRILGELSMAYNPNLQKSSKDTLVEECLSDPTRIQGLVLELEKMDGNVGAVCQALVELVRQLCSNKETMTLKLLCAQLAQKPQSLDILLLFEKLSTVLSPVCQLLDNWPYDDDQTEYQPVYDEYGSVLLLVLAFAYRYKVSGAYLGAQGRDSVVAKIIHRAHVARSMGELSEEEKNHVDGWLKGLFDDRTGGLGDDLMSSCTPGQYYLLIGTIFQNIVVGLTHGYVNEQTLTVGFEYLAETFLMPSLAPAMLFLAEYLWVDQKEQKSIIKVLQLVMKPSSAQEASIMLGTVKNLVAQPLAHALRTYQREDPRNQEIEPLIESLKENQPLSRRTGNADTVEMGQWATTTATGLSGAIRQTIQSLVQWSLQPGLGSSPPEYTHRQLVAGLKIIGAQRLLHLIAEEVRFQTEAGNANAVYDLATGLICAPDVTLEQPPPPPLTMDGAPVAMPSRPVTLRDALKTAADSWKTTQKKDPALAETLVRLHRRVEAQMILPVPEAQALLHDAMALPAGDALAAVAAAVDDPMAVDASALDASALDLGLDGGLDAADSDLFGLDTAMDVFDAWDGMELGGP